MALFSQEAPATNGRPVAAPRALVTSDDPQLGGRIQEFIARSDLECAAQHVVPTESAADRASRLGPALLVAVLAGDPERTYAAIQEIRRTVSTQVLVVGPADDPQLILRTLHEGGADEYLDQSQLESELTGALERFQGRSVTRAEAPPSGRVISVLAPSGGSGSSTVAVNLATSLAREHEVAALIDLRLAAGDLASLLNLQPEYSLADLCQNVDRLDHSMFPQFFSPHSSGVRLLAAPGRFSDIESVTAEGVRQAVSMARQEYPYVVVDLDNAYSPEQVEVLWQSDVVLLVIRLDYTSLRNAKRVLQHLDEAGIELNDVRLVVNRYGQRSQLRGRQVEEALGMKVFDYLPDEPSSINAAINAGIPVVLQRPRAKVSRQLARLAASVNGYLPTQH